MLLLVIWGFPLVTLGRAAMMTSPLSIGNKLLFLVVIRPAMTQTKSSSGLVVYLFKPTTLNLCSICLNTLPILTLNTLISSSASVLSGTKWNGIPFKQLLTIGL